MNFELDTEQELLRDSVRRWVEKEYSFSQRQKIRALPAGFSREHWRTMADLGWLGVGLPEDVGGLGQSMIEASIIAEELGRGLVLEPYVHVGVLAAQLIVLAASEQQRAAWLPPLIAGEQMYVLAHGEHESPGELSFVATRAERSANGWRLQGRKSLVFAAPTAHLMLVSARTAGSASDKDGLSLFMVDPAIPGIGHREYRTVDGTRAEDFVFDNVLLPASALVGPLHQAFPAVEEAHARAITVLCAEAVGMMEAALALTCSYLRERKQFGAPIGTFQALQHRAADMYIETQVARAALWRALAFLDNPDRQERQRAVSSAKAQVGRAARFVCSQAVQLHGGIALTEEFPIGHYFKRMTVFDLTFGNRQTHLRYLAQALGDAQKIVGDADAGRIETQNQREEEKSWTFN